MLDSQAEASEDDDYLEKGQNAQEYFKELEEKNPTPEIEGQTNSNADGGSIFN